MTFFRPAEMYPNCDTFVGVFDVRLERSYLAYSRGTVPWRLLWDILPTMLIASSPAEKIV